MAQRPEQGPLNDLSYQIIGAAIAVHSELGPGLLESVYESCLASELQGRGILVLRQPVIPICYRGRVLEETFRVDLIAKDLRTDASMIVELKAVDLLLPVHEAQLLTYLKLSGLQLGLLLNFNVPALRDGIRRLVNRFPDPESLRNSALSAPLR